MRAVLAPLQGAVFGIVAMHLTGSESLRFVVCGAVAFPLLAMLVATGWPRLATALGALLTGLWSATCGALAYEDPALRAWEWIPGFALLGLLFGAGANAQLFADAAATNLDRGPETERRPPYPPPRRTDEEPDSWKILNVAPGASQQEIARAFRARMAEYHPDKVAALGAELRELAERKSKDITTAYARLARR